MHAGIPGDAYSVPGAVDIDALYGSAVKTPEVSAEQAPVVEEVGQTAVEGAAPGTAIELYDKGAMGSKSPMAEVDKRAREAVGEPKHYTLTDVRPVTTSQEDLNDGAGAFRSSGPGFRRASGPGFSVGSEGGADFFSRLADARKQKATAQTETAAHESNAGESNSAPQPVAGESDDLEPTFSDEDLQWLRERNEANVNGEDNGTTGENEGGTAAHETATEQPTPEGQPSPEELAFHRLAVEYTVGQGINELNRRYRVPEALSYGDRRDYDSQMAQLVGEAGYSGYYNGSRHTLIDKSGDPHEVVIEKFIGANKNPHGVRGLQPGNGGRIKVQYRSGVPGTRGYRTVTSFLEDFAEKTKLDGPTQPLSHERGPREDVRAMDDWDAITHRGRAAAENAANERANANQEGSNDDNNGTAETGRMRKRVAGAGRSALSGLVSVPSGARRVLGATRRDAGRARTAVGSANLGSRVRNLQPGARLRSAAARLKPNPVMLPPEQRNPNSTASRGLAYGAQRQQPAGTTGAGSSDSLENRTAA